MRQLFTSKRALESTPTAHWVTSSRIVQAIINVAASNQGMRIESNGWDLPVATGGSSWTLFLLVQAPTITVTWRAIWPKLSTYKLSGSSIAKQKMRPWMAIKRKIYDKFKSIPVVFNLTAVACSGELRDVLRGRYELVASKCDLQSVLSPTFVRPGEGSFGN